jgi:hypothetical protein
MFDFDVVTGPTQPPHCLLADESAGESAIPAGAESALQPSTPAGVAASALVEPHTTKGEKARS